MGILSKIRRHAAVASADFASMFKEVEIPPLPAAVTRLIAEINQPEPDINELVKLISSAPGIAAKVVKTVNSSLFALRSPVTNVKQAVTLLGLRHIRSMALAYATMDGLPKPRGDLFDHEAFWTDSLLRAMLSRSFSKNRFSRQLEDAFTASLLADVAIPVLLSAWQEYYEPVIQTWKQGSKRLSEIEQEHFGWDHAQAGAWIVQSWDFPEEIVCYIGMHNLSWEKIHEHELEDTIVVPMALARILPSVLKPDGEHSECVFDAAVQWLSMTRAEFVDCLTEVRESFSEILELFGLSDRNASRALDDLEAGAGSGDEGDEK
jgi:HD-like signal output (HDOD) protein